MSASLVAHRFRTHKRLGAGSFGEIFVGSDVNTGMRVAMKFEKHGLRCPQLRHEYKVYRELQGCRGVCKVQYYGTHNNFNVMILDLLGPSLEELFTKCGRRFSLKTTLKLADQMLERCEALHGRHLIHRDIKPANFTMGDATTSPMVYCIDFGLSKRFRNPHTLQHIPHRVGKSLTGTPRYASISNHLGIEQSRRDDLEAIGYVLVYFAKGRLPWQGLKAKSAHKKYKLILDKKQEISIAQLCHGCPAQFAEYLSYCRSLKFDASPNVAYLRRLFRDLYVQSGYDINHLQSNDWDWMVPGAGVDASPRAAAAAPGQPAAPTGGAAPAAVQSGDAAVQSKRVVSQGMRPQSAGAERPKSAAAAAASSRADFSSAAFASSNAPRTSSARSGGGAPAGGRDVFLRDGGPSAQEAAKFAYDHRYRRPKTASNAREAGDDGGGRDGGVDRSRAWGSHARAEPPHGGGARRDRPASAGAAAVGGAQFKGATSSKSAHHVSERGGGRGQGAGDDGAHVVAGARSMMGLARARSMKTSSTGATGSRPRTSSRG